MKQQTKEDRLILALLSTGSIREAASVAGISERTAYSKLKKPEFQRKYEQARLELIRSAMGYAQAAMTDAISKARSILDNPESSPQTILNAADMLIRNACRLSESYNYGVRIEALEKAVNNEEHGHTD